TIGLAAGRARRPGMAATRRFLERHADDAALVGQIRGGAGTRCRRSEPAGVVSTRRASALSHRSTRAADATYRLETLARPARLHADAPPAGALAAISPHRPENPDDLPVGICRPADCAALFRRGLWLFLLPEPVPRRSGGSEPADRAVHAHLRSQ